MRFYKVIFFFVWRTRSDKCISISLKFKTRDETSAKSPINMNGEKHGPTFCQIADLLGP